MTTGKSMKAIADHLRTNSRRWSMALAVLLSFACVGGWAGFPHSWQTLFGSDVLPAQDATYSLGNSSLRWKNGTFSGTVTASTLAGPAALGNISGSLGANDNRVVRTDGTGGSTIQGSLAVLDDSGNLSGVSNMTATTYISTAGDGYAAYRVNDGRTGFGGDASYGADVLLSEGGSYLLDAYQDAGYEAVDAYGDLAVEGILIVGFGHTQLHGSHTGTRGTASVLQFEAEVPSANFDSGPAIDVRGANSGNPVNSIVLRVNGSPSLPASISALTATSSAIYTPFRIGAGHTAASGDTGSTFELNGSSGNSAFSITSRKANGTDATPREAISFRFPTSPAGPSSVEGMNVTSKRTYIGDQANNYILLDPNSSALGFPEIRANTYLGLTVPNSRQVVIADTAGNQAMAVYPATTKVVQVLGTLEYRGNFKTPLQTGNGGSLTTFTHFVGTGSSTITLPNPALSGVFGSNAGFEYWITRDNGGAGTITVNTAAGQIRCQTITQAAGSVTLGFNTDSSVTLTEEGAGIHCHADGTNWRCSPLGIGIGT